MNNLETLKQELISQKEEIERMSGIVRVSGTNPSPSEITAGIKTIPSSDLSISTATESDVKQGKTFFSGTPELKTGTAIIDSDSINHLFMTNYSTITTQDTVYYACPQDLTTIRRYCFYLNFNPINFTFSSSLTHIEDYAFYKCKNMSFNNFENLTNLIQISSSAFQECGTDGLNYEFGNSLIRIYGSAFFGSVYDGATIRIPPTIAILGTQAFYQNTRKNSCYLNVEGFPLATLPNYSFYNIGFSNKFDLPSAVTTIGDGFNLNGCFTSIKIHENIVKLGNNCFGSVSTNPLSDFYLRDVVFEKETPPTFGTIVFAKQNIQNGFKIYVPDNAVDAYKAVANLSYCSDNIYPISEKE